MLDFKREITNEAEAKAFIVDLVDAGKDFHFDDDPAEVVNGNSASGERLFAEHEIVDVRRRRDELFEHLNDPFDELIAENNFREMLKSRTLVTSLEKYSGDPEMRRVPGLVFRDSEGRVFGYIQIDDYSGVRQYITEASTFALQTTDRSEAERALWDWHCRENWSDE